MKKIVQYNPEQKTITINDGIRNPSLWMRILLPVLIIDFIILYQKSTRVFSHYFWGILLLLYIILLALNFKNYVVSKQISVAIIDYIRHKTGNKRDWFIIHLKNGKKRQISTPANDREMILDEISKAGIPVNKF